MQTSLFFVAFISWLRTAKILCPNKTVLLPDFDAGCTLADDCQPDDFQKFLDKHPDHFAISYINCSAAVKAKSDLICTSSNAVDLVKQITQRSTNFIFTR